MDAKKPEGVLGRRRRGPRAGHGDPCCSAGKSATQGPQAKRETLPWEMSKTQGVYIVLSSEQLTLCFTPGRIRANKKHRLALSGIYTGGSCSIFFLARVSSNQTCLAINMTDLKVQMNIFFYITFPTIPQCLWKKNPNRNFNSSL